MTEMFVVKQKRYEPSDPRLGRHVRHDSRSLLYQVEARPMGELKSAKHTSSIPTLNQGNIGSCTGNAGTKNLSYGDFWLEAIRAVLSESDADLDERYAVQVYGLATALDPFDGVFPPTDTGSDGLSVAKVLQQLGFISGYEHATSLEATLTALSRQAVMTGTEWRGDMFNPEPDGRIRITGSVEGGHEYVLDELDLPERKIWMQNSWDVTWGVDGRAYFTFDDFEELLHADGDVTVLTPLTQPAPTPTPVPDPEPTPTPTPDPGPEPSVVDQKSDFLTAATQFDTALHTFIEWYSNGTA